MRPGTTAQVGIAVAERARSRSIGTALMRFAEHWALDHDCTMIVLDTSAMNTGALRLYERLGYEPYGVMLRKSIV